MTSRLLLALCAASQLSVAPTLQGTAALGSDGNGTSAPEFLDGFQPPAYAPPHLGLANRPGRGFESKPSVVDSPSGQGAASPIKPECSIRVLRGDPQLDPKLIRPVDPPLDLKMAVLSPCAN